MFIKHEPHNLYKGILFVNMNQTNFLPIDYCKISDVHRVPSSSGQLMMLKILNNTFKSIRGKISVEISKKFKTDLGKTKPKKFLKSDEYPNFTV